MRKLLPVGSVVALLAVATWWLLRTDTDAPPLQPPSEPVAAAPAAPMAVTPESGSAIAPPAEASDTKPAVEREAVPAAASRPEHTLRGRIVDAAGQPLAGIEASLTGWTGNSQRMAAWAKDNPEPARIAQKATTGADGVFTFACWPPPPFQFSLRLQGTGVATWSQRWNEWAPGGTTDLGDVKLERGTLVRGRVVDSAGAPIAKVEVRIDAVGRERTRGGFEYWCTARTGEDGSFQQRWPLLAGDYKFGIDDQILERGETVTVTGDAEQFVDIVVKRIDPADSIRGIVVDDAGAPIRSVMVHAHEVPSGRVISTDAEGWFRVLKREGAPAEITLSFTARGFTAPATTEKYAWGRHDVRIVMVRGKDLAVLVVRAADGTPFEDYVLRVIPLDGGFNSMDHEPRGKPPHKDGRVAVRGIAVGKHRVLVSPKGDDLALSAVSIEVGPNGAAPVTIRLAANQPRTVRVEKVGGTPVAGAKVQLVDPCGEPWSETMPLFSPTGSSFASGANAIELAVATTDANGECTLPVPGDRALALMLPGPGHVPLAVRHVTFPAEGPFVVTVGDGATLRGKVGPEAAWAHVMRGGDGGAIGRSRAMAPSVSLSRGSGFASERFPDFRTRHAVNDDGTFELTGIPPGRWNAFLDYFSSGPGGIGKQEPLGEVDLVDGQVTTLTPDLSGLLPGTLEALVLHNGAPLANTMVNFAPLVPGNPWPQAEAGATTGADGRVIVAVRGGQYTAMWYPPSQSHSPTLLRSNEVAVVRVGETTKQTFTIQSGAVKVRLVDGAGKPVSNMLISLADATGAATAGLGPTSSDGRAEKKLSTGTFTATVMPKRLMDQKAMMAFARTITDPSQWQAVMVPIGSLTVVAGETNEVELKLPADW